jgi:hypothetical protein
VCLKMTNAEIFVSKISLNLRYKYVLFQNILHANHFHSSIARFRVDQNICISGSSFDDLGPSDWNTAVSIWYNKVKDMNPADVPNFQ